MKPVVDKFIGGLLSLALLIGAAGCAGDGQVGGTEIGVSLYRPSKIEILPFTRVTSFDKDQIPDGVEVVLRLIDPLGDAMKAYGRYHFELFEYREASAYRQGERLLFWQTDVNSVAAQRRLWDRITRTYQFQLGWDRPLVPNRKYLLEVTFLAQGQKRLYAEHLLDFRLPTEHIRELWQQ